MKVLMLSQAEEFEKRVVISPDVIKRYKKLGIQVYLKNQAGVQAGFSDEEYEGKGAHLFTDLGAMLPETDCLLSIRAPSASIADQLPPSSPIIAMTQGRPEWNNARSLFLLEKMPRITRAQSMDVLSSQSNLSGYKAVVDAFAAFGRVVPMMMTAAGMIQPAKVLVLGAGVAGLQAIATAKRMGAIVYAFDVRRSAKEQVESLSAEFIAVDDAFDAQDDSGYATAVDDEYKKKQHHLIDEYARLCDIVITTALIPNQPAPVLIEEATVKAMKSGSVIVDLATSMGGNCSLSVKNKVIKQDGVTVMGYENLARHLPATASELLANNFFNFFQLLFDQNQGKIVIDEADEIIKSTLVKPGQ